MVKGRQQTLPQLFGRGGIRVAPGQQEDLGRIESGQLILDRLDQILVPDPGAGVHAGQGQGGDRDDQVALGPVSGSLEIRRPAPEEPPSMRRT